MSTDVFREFFFHRYKRLCDFDPQPRLARVPAQLRTVNRFVPLFIEMGADVLNMQQPRAYGIRELGEAFAGRVCFLTTVDIQATLPAGDADAVRAEARTLVENWSTPKGGLIVFNYGDSEAIGTSDAIAEVMFKEFYDLRHYWTDNHRS